MLLIRRHLPDGTLTEQEFDGAELSIGRATVNDLQLPGLLVAQQHARVTVNLPRGLKLESLTTAGVETEGRIGVQAVELRSGDELRIGGHRLRLEPPADGSGWVLDVDVVESRDVLMRAGASTDLAGAGWTQRRWALWLAGAALVLGLLIPLISRYVPLPAAVSAILPTDHLWLSGRVSNAHAHFAGSCGACHETLFVQVRDQACLKCHDSVAQHSDNPAIFGADGIEGRRCASCHREHGGAHAVLPAHPGVCTDCHANPKFADFPDLQEVRDFGKAHPEFRPTVAVMKDGNWATARASLGEARDRSGLAYPHDLHLKAEGVQGPEGKEVLKCPACHVPDLTKAGFKPIGFEPHCQRCHQLDVLTESGAERLPHGDNDQVRNAIRAMFSREKPLTRQIADVFSRLRPGDDARRGGPQTADEMIEEVFEKRVCVKCHEILREPGKAPGARAPELQESWLVHARYTHADHTWVSCGECHAAESSKTSEDLLLPSIKSCRNCHGGVDSAQGVQSTCIDCHAFHQASKLTFGKFTGALADEAEPAKKELGNSREKP